MNKNMICTIASYNYFAQVKCLAKSIHEFNKDIEFFVLIADRTSDKELIKKVESSDYITKVFYIEDLNIKNIVKMEFKYDIVEFNTALKPFFLEFLLDEYHCNNITYIDPDILIFGSLEELFELQKNNSIILTPHLLDSTKSDKLIIDFLSYGIYNLGFISVNNDGNGRKLLSWWKKVLVDYCYLDLEKSLAWDQKWMDFAPSLFDSVYILKNPGYNFAYWNMNERTISKKDGIYFVNSNYRLIFFHFSHFNPKFKDEIAHIDDFGLRYKVNVTPEITEIYDFYYNMLMENGYEYFSKLRYGFSKFNNGATIQKIHRRLYTKLDKLSSGSYEDPFDTSNEDCFYNYSRDIFLNL
jgi:hypothetical protein